MHYYIIKILTEFTITLLFSGILKFIPNFVAKDFVPVDFRPGDGQLAAKCFEGRVRHRLVVFRYRRLQ